MKNFLYLVLFCFVFNCCYFGALNAKHPLTLILVAAAAVVLFAWLMVSRHKKRAERRHMEQLFEEFMRTNRHSPRF
jgi:Flp pilus assembly protein TadB